MTSTTIFKTCSLDRNEVKWEDYLYKQTPVEEHFDPETGLTMKFKREDKFNPLSNTGYGINGAKLRQAIWLHHTHISEGGHPDLFSASVCHSPQLLMGAAIANHYGGQTYSVLGVTTPEKCLKHDMVKGASWFGTKWDFIGSGFNNALQPHCKKLNKELNPKGFFMEYGISLDHNLEKPSRIAAFHEVGGEQVKNIPDDVETLILPFGSANSATSIFTGLAKYKKPNLKKIILIGIGPNKIKWIENRLKIIGDELGYKDILAWKKNYTHNKDLESKTKKSKFTNLFEAPVEEQELEPLFEVQHYDLHTTKWVSYNDLMHHSWGDIVLHPRYEGKVMKYVLENLRSEISPKALFWIVGGYPSISEMQKTLPHLGDLPEKVETVSLNSGDE